MAWNDVLRNRIKPPQNILSAKHHSLSEIAQKRIQMEVL